MLEEIGKKLIVGLKGEKYFDAGELYTVFWNAFEYEVFYNDQAIGSLCPDTNVEIGMSVFLAAKMWRIVEIDNERMRIYVDTASVGDAPIFKGTGGYDVSYEVEKDMSEILFDDEIYPVLDAEGAEALKELRNENKCYQRIGSTGILFLNNGVSMSLLPLCGTKVEKTLSWLLYSYFCMHKGLGCDREIIVHGDLESFEHVLSRIDEIGTENEKLLIQSIEKISWDSVAKFSIILPQKLQVRLAYDRLFDLDTALKVIREMLDESFNGCIN